MHLVAVALPGHRAREKGGGAVISRGRRGEVVTESIVRAVSDIAQAVKLFGQGKQGVGIRQHVKRLRFLCPQI